jgi:hypothetical protein
MVDCTDEERAVIARLRAVISALPGKAQIQVLRLMELRGMVELFNDNGAVGVVFTSSGVEEIKSTIGEIEEWHANWVKMGLPTVSADTVPVVDVDDYRVTSIFLNPDGGTH